MSISGITNSIRNGSQRLQQAFYDCVPNRIVNSEKWQKRIKWVGSEISSPENRLILGVTALMSQPFIDAHNKSVDEDTRKVSVCRTIAKIVAGTLTGYAIRKGCISAINKWSKLPTSVDKNGQKIKLTSLNTFFSPTNAYSDLTEPFKQYRNALGTIAALMVMTVTNFLIDAPLTKYLTNKFVAASGGVKNETSK
ncbi:hypothetical protein KID03_06640 [bacterium]|uniref:Uncharacterized protein n=1 Tax=Candidatus Scatenecus faecavium TaxID=2840915 RepID=A0A9D1K3A7_9BACT|nr:hypothetical protein [bacterium]HIS82735.1 hypothetical protein [Candidatus Scatenecus faecavium]